MSISTINYDMYLQISSFLVKSDMMGFILSCKRMQSLLLWCHDDVGVHINLGCDLTGSMARPYNNLKIHLLKLLRELKHSPILGRTLFSSFWFWDVERSHYSNNPYVQIQPPTETITKQELLISDAKIDSGGGPECGGIALCELDTQFKNRWIGQRGSFGQALDIMCLCLDAPFHFLVDDESYFEITRKHAIKKDWIAAIHNICNKGVLIILIIINNQPLYEKPLRLMGGFVDALGGIALQVNPNSLHDLPNLIKGLIEEESQKRKIIANVYRKTAYKYQYLSPDRLDAIMKEKIAQLSTEIKCVNIPSGILVKANDVSNARELATCKNMQEAINKGLLESEEITKRLYYNTHKRPMPHSGQHTGYLLGGASINPICASIPDLHMGPIPMSRTQSVSGSSEILPKTFNKRSYTIEPQIKHVHTSLDEKMPDMIHSFGLVRQQSISYDPYANTQSEPAVILSLMPTISEDSDTKEVPLLFNNGIVEGSIKCYLRNPDIDLGYIATPLLQLAESTTTTSEQKFRDMLQPNQYQLYMNGGLFSRFGKQPDNYDDTISTTQMPSLTQSTFRNNSISLVDTTVLTRSLTEIDNDSVQRILQFVRTYSR
jgi:hypothetical protein